MTEEEYFRKNYPDFCYGDRPLSPHWDFFQDGVEFGERQSEKKIEELENKNTELKEFYENEYFQISDRTADEKIKELEKHQVEVTIDDYSPYDENTWGDMHEEWFVPKEEVRGLLQENYALITKAKEYIQTLISCLIDWVQEGDKDYCYIADAEQFLKEIKENE